ncbi:hypothetical protein [Paractinoplanes durhamensis]|uniref:Uncharacterized protein n=1 Tax=Paractinoplanes durhamensis TaxID=113563 RepID=A0ABQ3Z4T3_9ACTN|nr:hypothetical protein [Actinoplanes durhamensis]GIE04833.1 hypothetical protein Adu01nite_61830 [Actinoplanes durhamensis]
MRNGWRAAVTALALLTIVMTGTPAQAAGKLSVSKTKGLARAGQTVTVTGSGYDVTKGIYVAFCLDNGAGVLPSPCGGGADMTGSSGGSAWISSHPPSYGEGLATPYGKNGSFRVSIHVSQMIGTIDCAVRGCAIVTRNDHTRSNDRSQDVRVPIRFAAAATGSGSGVSATPVPGSTAAAPAVKQSKPIGPPSGKLATEAPPAAAVTEVAELQAFAPTLTRTSTATPLGHWWAIGGAFLTGLLLAVVTGRIRRARRGSM